MPSNIDPTKPTYKEALTSDVRANFAAAKTEIESLQQDILNWAAGGPFLPLSGGTLLGPLTLSGNAYLDYHAVTLNQLNEAISNGPFLPLTGGIVTGATTFGAPGRVTITSNVITPPNIASTLLQITGADAQFPHVVFDTFGGWTQLTYRSSLGTASVPTALVNGTNLGAINFYGHNGSVYSGAQAEMRVVAEAAWSASSMPTRFSWYTAPISGSVAETMRLNQAGNLMLGGVYVPDLGHKLQVHQGTVAPAVTKNIYSAIDSISGSSGSPTFVNAFQISGDNSTTPATTLLNISHQFGGPAYSGSTTALNIGLTMNAASIPTNTRYYMGANVFTSTSNSAGGTDTTAANSRGNFYGLNVTSQLLNGATNWTELTSAEIDSSLATGSTASRRVNLKLMLQNNHAVQGSVQDVMLELGLIRGGTTGTLMGIALGTIESLFPIDNINGVFIGHSFGSLAQLGIQPQLKTFIDASHIRALTAHWLSPGASIDGSGNYTSGPARMAWSTSGLSLDVSGQVGGIPTVISGGTVGNGLGAFNGQLVTTGNGDLYTVVASGGVISAMNVIVAATSRTTGPTAAQTILGDGIVGATCTIPWTNARTLSLQPNGGAITSPLFINAANDSLAASAGVGIGQWYRNGSVMMQRVA